jgi:predicted nucleotidyltransferase
MHTIVRNMRTISEKTIDWLFPEVRKRVLSLLLTSPADRLHLRDIVRQTGSAVGTVRRELTGLAGAGIVTKVKDGNRTYYQANTACPVYGELAGLVRKTTGLAKVLAKALEPLSENITLAFIYGSFAAGFAGTDSDVDLMVIGRCTFGQVVEVLHNVQNDVGREINPTVYPTDEFRQKLVDGDHFIGGVLCGEKIFLIGDTDELARLAK